MTYSVNQLAKLSGITVRTLHFYDEIGLLKPAYVAENGYRFYQEKQLLVLQQVLFFRELGFELKQIQEILKQDNFDQLEALRAHKKVLRKNISRMTTLMKTVDKTINHLEGKEAMKENEMFEGFAQVQKEMKSFQHELMNAWTLHVGTTEIPTTETTTAPQSIPTGKEWEEYRETTLATLSNMPPAILSAWLNGATPGTPEFEALLIKRYEARNLYAETKNLFTKMSDVYSRNYAAESPEMQTLVKEHYELYKTSMPSHEKYIGGSNFYLDPISQTTFANYPTGFAAFLAKAMKVFADIHLS